MAEGTVTYKVETVYEAVDRTSRSMGEIERSTRQAAQSSQSLVNILKGMGAAFVGSRVFSEAKKIFIDYNAQIENHKVVLAGMLTMYTGMPIEKSWDRAGTSVERFTEMAKKSSLTTKDLVETASMLTRPLLQAGMSMQQIEKLTFGAANAGKAFGIGGSVAAMDIEQALTTGVHQRDRFMRSILAQKEVNLSMDKFNSLSKEKQVDAVVKGLSSNAVSAMAKKQGEGTFEGVKSTLEDTFQIMMSKVGLPLFTAITEEIRNWNGWLDKNQSKLTEIGKTVGHGMVSAFSTIKDVMSWIWSHGDMLINIAKAWAVVKIGQTVGGGLATQAGGFFGHAGGLGEFFRPGKKASDSFDPFTGEYKYNAAQEGGRGFQKVGGLKGLAENAALIGAVGGAGYALGTLMNRTYQLSDTFAKAVTVHGEVLDITDQTTSEYARLIESMDSMDKAIGQASDALRGLAGAAGTQAAANIQGTSKFYGQQANLLGDILRNEMEHTFDLKTAPGIETWKKISDSKLFDSNEMMQIQKDPHKAQAMFDTMARTAAQRQQAAIETANTAVQNIPKDLKDAVDESTATQALMQKALQVLPGGGVEGLKSGQYVAAIVMDEKMIRAALEGVIEKGQARVNQTVNINIQMLAAKDPNKWLAQMEDVAAGRNRSATRAKRAWKNTAQ